MATTASAGGYNCSVALLINCDPGCGAWYEGPDFDCCSTYGQSCCARQCSVYECLQGNYNGPCNEANQVDAAAGPQMNNQICVQGNYCSNPGH